MPTTYPITSANAPARPSPTQQLPDGFVYLDNVEPTIVVELRYAGHHNFIGRPIAGYQGVRAIITGAAASALTAVQADLGARGLGLKVCIMRIAPSARWKNSYAGQCKR